MKCLVVDDEGLARERLRRLLEAVEGVEVCGEAANGREALLQADALSPDVIFLDIRMPGMDGMEAARHLAALEQPPAVVFTTAYGEHALEAFEARAVDYLLKPVRPEHIERALHSARRLNRVQLSELGPAGQGEARSHICVRVRGDLRLIPVEEIRIFQADNKYVSVHTPEGEVLIEESLKSLEEEFADRFLRVHRGALVARAYFKALAKDAAGHTVAVVSGVELRPEVSRRHGADVRRWLQKGGS